MMSRLKFVIGSTVVLLNVHGISACQAKVTLTLEDVPQPLLRSGTTGGGSSRRWGRHRGSFALVKDSVTLGEGHECDVDG